MDDVIKSNFLDALGRCPDFLADEKIKAVMSSIYEQIIAYAKQNDSAKIAELISDFGTEQFVSWFITNVFLPEVDDIKLICYISDHHNDIIGSLAAALSNLTPKQAADSSPEPDPGQEEQSQQENDEEATTEPSEDSQQVESPFGGGEDEEAAKEPLEPQEEADPLEVAFAFVDSFSKIEQKA